MGRSHPKLTHGDREAIALTRVPAELRKLEAGLMTTKWYDYRPLHPVDATLYFARCYEYAIRDAYRQTRDANTADALTVLEQDNVLLTRDGVSFWQARQACDQVGCRYEFALRWMMNRFGDRGWHMFPRPNQLYSVELVMDLDDAWKIECGASMQFPRSAFYKNDRYIGHPDQVAYRCWITAQIRARSTDHSRPLSRVLGEGVMDVEFAVGEFGHEVTAKAHAIATSMLSHA